LTKAAEGARRDLRFEKSRAVHLNNSAARNVSFLGRNARQRGMLAEDEVPATERGMVPRMTNHSVYELQLELCADTMHAGSSRRHAGHGRPITYKLRGYSAMLTEVTRSSSDGIASCVMPNGKRHYSTPAQRTRGRIHSLDNNWFRESEQKRLDTGDRIPAVKLGAEAERNSDSARHVRHCNATDDSRVDILSPAGAVASKPALHLDVRSKVVTNDVNHRPTFR
jgi:hypothetical protein